MAEFKSDDVQGDLFSRGFPKFNEVYYFFHIKSGKEKEFCQKLKSLVSCDEQHISTISKVLDDWKRVDAAAAKNRTIEDFEEKEWIHALNTLIAFSKPGLDRIQKGLTSAGRPSLDLKYLSLSDPTFDMGMGDDGPENLNDPPVEDWDPLFRTTTIHGLLKIAGSDSTVINDKLDHLKHHLGHPTVITDIEGNSPPQLTKSKLEGSTRPRPHRGLEHFGYQDGLSQPLLKGINSDEAIKADPYMLTDQNVITISANPPELQDGIEADQTRRPRWMVNGSFLAFRKLEQDVQGWNDLLSKYKDAGCKSPAHLGAKLMGRWPSGHPISKYPEEDAPPGTPLDNNFRYKGVSKFNCPFGAHIRKINPRTDGGAVTTARMIRNGIPYGTDFDPENPPTDPKDTRGLLFVAYQSCLENGFQFLQKSWCNGESFPVSKTGYDPIAGQAKDRGLLNTTLHNEDDTHLTPGVGQFKEVSTMKGGEYFFVPSISALRNTLGCD